MSTEKVAIPIEKIKPIAQKVFMSEGNVPLSSDVDAALENVKNDRTFTEIKSSLRSDAGKKLAHDLDSLIATGQDVAHSDQDNNLAKMLLHAKKAKQLGENEPYSEEANNVGQSLDFAYASAINLIKLMATSPQFRGTLNGLMSLLLDTVKVNALPESQQNLANVSGKGETTTLGHYGNQAARAAEERGYTAENMKQRVGGTAEHLKQRAADVTGSEQLRNMNVGQEQGGFQSQSNTFTGQNQGFQNRGVQQQGLQNQPIMSGAGHPYQSTTGSKLNPSHPQSTPAGKSLLILGNNFGQSSVQPSAYNSGRVGAQNPALSYHHQTTHLEAGNPALDQARPSTQAAHVATEIRNIASSKLKNIEIPDAISDKALNLFIDKMVYLRSKPEFRKALGDIIEGLKDVIENILAKGQQLQGNKEEEEITFIAKVHPTDQEAVIPVFVPAKEGAAHRSPSEREWAQAYTHGRQLLEKQSSGTELKVLIREAKQFLNLVASDEKLRSWFDSVTTWLERGMNEDGYLKSEAFPRDFRRLRQDFRDSIMEKHNPEVDALSNAGRNYIKAVGNDPNVVAMEDISSSFFSNMFLDDSGNFTLKQDLLQDFSRMIPILNKRFARMQLPGIVHEDDDVYAMIDNVMLESTGLIPDVFDVTTRTRVDIGNSRFDGVFAVQ